ncbi:MAG TPA: hypothetical protein VEX86_05170 [Longimicrobium sp.]|nr:hypothetical protein [Longimicrobium sp.]
MPDQLVWEFAVDLCTKHSFRVVARMVELAPETVRKFVNRTGVPNLATRRRFAVLYLERNGEGVVAEEQNTKRWKARRRLIELLTEGEGLAREELAKIFELAKRFPDEVPKSVDGLHEWMDLQVRGEYWAEDYYGAIGRGEREHDEQSFLARIPKRTQKRKKKSESTETPDE